MARKPYAALGIVITPHGDVTVRKVWRPKKGSFVFQFEGQHLALRWMLPTWISTVGSTKTQFTPPRVVPTAEDAQALFNRMAAAWQQRMAQPSVADAQQMVPLEFHRYSTLNQLRVIVEGEINASLRASSIATYRHQWNAVFAHISGETLVQNLDRVQVQDAVTKMSLSGLAPVTVRQNIRSLNRLLNRAVEDGVLASNPAAKVKLPKKTKRAVRFLNKDEREKLLGIARSRGRNALLLVALGMYLGLRKAELCAIKWSQIDLAQKVVHVENQEHFTTKSGKNRAIPICEELMVILKSVTAWNGYVLKPRNQPKAGKRYRWEFRGLLAGMVAEAGLKKWMTPHVMRHTFASIAAQGGVSLFKIGSWMGHTMSEVTEIYAHLAAYDSDINHLNREKVPPTVSIEAQRVDAPK
jgi:integrase